jgi:hypothetical protein
VRKAIRLQFSLRLRSDISRELIVNIDVSGVIYISLHYSVNSYQSTAIHNSRHKANNRATAT